jgi:hypothetical protein
MMVSLPLGLGGEEWTLFLGYTLGYGFNEMLWL